ncbi:MAG: DUF3616 domain-containing protein [Massilia sp.]|nr:DUF3616 domain-containing protein [Massilia sp.]
MNGTFNAIAFALAAAGVPKLASAQVFVHKGLCDASAAATLDARHFIVADDEKNILWMFDRKVAAPVGAVNLWEFLGINKKDESDIEGAATIGNRTYWISSHGQNKRGGTEPSRHQFFASEFAVQAGGAPTVRLVGKPYTRLLEDLIADDKRFGQYDFARASKLAPKQPGALNIEGLADTADGKLLIGFRNPLARGKALVIPLNNARQLLDGAGNGLVRASFGDAIELDLQGRGIRSIERVSAGYYIVAGPVGDDGAFGIYRWSGMAGAAPVLLHLPILDGLHPESLVVPAAGKIQILSDDGRKLVGGTACKDLPKEARSFRSVTINQ